MYSQIWVMYKFMLMTSQVENAVKVLEELIEKQNKQSLDSVYISATSECLLMEILITCTSVHTKNTLNHHSWYCQRDYAFLFNSMTSYPVKSCECLFLFHCCGGFK